MVDAMRGGTVKIVLVVEVAHDDIHQDRRVEVVRVIAEDVQYMLNEKHGGIYRTTEAFVDEKEVGY